MEYAPYRPPAGSRTGKITRKPVSSAPQSQSQSNNLFKAPLSPQAKSNNPFAVAATSYSTAPDNSVSTSASNNWVPPAFPLSRRSISRPQVIHLRRLAILLLRQLTLSRHPLVLRRQTVPPSISPLAPAAAASNNTTGNSQLRLSPPDATN
jgi:hypothetical protein